MLGNVEHIKRSLEQVRDLVQTSIQNERAREGAKSKGYDDEHDMPMYGDGLKPQYGITEVKKRRGVSFQSNMSDKVSSNITQACGTSWPMPQLQPD